MKPELKYEAGKLVAKVAMGVDGDKDQVNAMELELAVKIDVLEAITEIAKTDLPWLKEIIEKIG